MIYYFFLVYTLRILLFEYFFLFLLLMIRLLPRSTRTYILVPYTTFFRSARPPAPPPDAGFSLAPWPDGGTGLRVDGGRGIPILGGLAAIFGIAALFNTPIVLGPLALAFGIAALFRRQVSLGVPGGMYG